MSLWPPQQPPHLTLIPFLATSMPIIHQPRLQRLLRMLPRLTRITNSIVC